MYEVLLNHRLPRIDVSQSSGVPDVEIMVYAFRHPVLSKGVEVYNVGIVRAMFIVGLVSHWLQVQIPLQSKFVSLSLTVWG